MKKSLTKLMLVLFIVLATVMSSLAVANTTVKAATGTIIPVEQVSSMEEGTVIIGRSRFSSTYVITGEVAARAGSNDAKAYIAANGSFEGYSEPKMYTVSMGDVYGYDANGNVVATSPIAISSFEVAYIDEVPQISTDTPVVDTMCTVTFVNSEENKTVTKRVQPGSTIDPDTLDVGTGSGTKAFVYNVGDTTYEFTKNTKITSDIVVFVKWLSSAKVNREAELNAEIAKVNSDDKSKAEVIELGQKFAVASTGATAITKDVVIDGKDFTISCESDTPIFTITGAVAEKDTIYVTIKNVELKNSDATQTASIAVTGYAVVTLENVKLSDETAGISVGSNSKVVIDNAIDMDAEILDKPLVTLADTTAKVEFNSDDVATAYPEKDDLTYYSNSKFVTVTFDCAGGKFTPKATADVKEVGTLSFEIVKGDKVSDPNADNNAKNLVEKEGYKPEKPTREGYTFAGWLSKGTNIVTLNAHDFTKAIEQDTTIVADWSSVTKVVKNVDELKAAIAKTSIERIEFANNIEVKAADLSITVASLAKDLVIDGKGYKLTYKATSNETLDQAIITVEEGSHEVVVKNMAITGNGMAINVNNAAANVTLENLDVAQNKLCGIKVTTAAAVVAKDLKMADEEYLRPIISSDVASKVDIDEATMIEVNSKYNYYISYKTQTVNALVKAIEDSTLTTYDMTGSVTIEGTVSPRRSTSAKNITVDPKGYEIKLADGARLELPEKAKIDNSPVAIKLPTGTDEKATVAQKVNTKELFDTVVASVLAGNGDYAYVNEIMLTADIELDAALDLTAGQILAINLNGHKITLVENSSEVLDTELINNAGTLTVKNGTLVAGDAVAILTTGNVELDGVTVSGKLALDVDGSVQVKLNNSKLNGDDVAMDLGMNAAIVKSTKTTFSASKDGILATNAAKVIADASTKVVVDVKETVDTQKEDVDALVGVANAGYAEKVVKVAPTKYYVDLGVYNGSKEPTALTIGGFTYAKDEAVRFATGNNVYYELPVWELVDGTTTIDGDSTVKVQNLKVALPWLVAAAGVEKDARVTVGGQTIIARVYNTDDLKDVDVLRVAGVAMAPDTTEYDEDEAKEAKIDPTVSIEETSTNVIAIKAGHKASVFGVKLNYTGSNVVFLQNVATGEIDAKKMEATPEATANCVITMQPFGYVGAIVNAVTDSVKYKVVIPTVGTTELTFNTTAVVIPEVLPEA